LRSSSVVTCVAISRANPRLPSAMKATPTAKSSSIPRPDKTRLVTDQPLRGGRKHFG
jgi:hypothetical protein